MQQVAMQTALINAQQAMGILGCLSQHIEIQPRGNHLWLEIGRCKTRPNNRGQSILMVLCIDQSIAHLCRIDTQCMTHRREKDLVFPAKIVMRQGRGHARALGDITDRHIDGSVTRTASRPIPSGQVTLRGALVWLVMQALIAFAILLTFNAVAIGLGVLSLLPVCIYPFAKRFTWWPQVFLGLAFNWGALLAWTAHTGSLGWPAAVLYLSGIAWTLFYDTIYAHQDAEDDALIGVKSTARLFAERTPLWLRRFLVIAVSLQGFAVILAVIGASPYAILLALCGTWAFGWHLQSQLASTVC